MIFIAFSRALAQLGDPRFRKVLLVGVGLTVALLIAVSTGVIWGLTLLVGEETHLPLIGPVTWLDDLLGWSSLLLMLVLSMFLMVPVASAISSMFLDEVAQAVEDRHYPSLPRIASTSILDDLADTLAFLGVLIVANLLAFVLYALFPPLTIFIFWGLNGFLLGREYFTLAAMRRLGREGAKTLRRKHALTIWAAGTLMAMPLSVPLVNLVIPILGAATFTQLYHLIEKTPRG
ncbi:Uncharacterized protein involved in cysteine biosynthesis [Salinihabitans flavidus]|uniref:Uncharacterized protein involved in cysteine biosynthesis n=1 Tax=Salinihabitans flavidus TaxID=569882 RepID=A0A1H8Q468_9RHOB|nr:EI24 domain-containing protein [Salinihabitans flavidus]SEO49045.1 Uncharacterized protein involved in cysteine biosynthesis [Salinihabitans flavidus]